METQKNPMFVVVVGFIIAIGRLVFGKINNSVQTCNIIESFNKEIQKTEYIDFRQIILGMEFEIPIFDELDREQLIAAVSGLFWDTSYKLFKQIFSDDSKYMTVH